MADPRDQCILCNRKLIHRQRDRLVDWYECDRCGGYGVDVITRSALGNDSLREKVSLSAFTRGRETAEKPPVLTKELIEQIRASAPRNSDIDAKARLLLRYIARKSAYAGHLVELSFDLDAPICYAVEEQEFFYYCRYLKAQEWATGEATLDARAHFTLTPLGWSEATATPNVESSTAFVAMWFDEQMSDAFKEGLYPAIFSDAHYNPIRIDREQFNDTIDDQIIAAIRESRFLVAEFTGHRGGVYFEAGFALGLGLPVIYICREDHIAQAHFDTRQYNHIVWKVGDYASLREQLANRIRATIGMGPIDPAAAINK